MSGLLQGLGLGLTHGSHKFFVSLLTMPGLNLDMVCTCTHVSGCECTCVVYVDTRAFRSAVIGTLARRLIGAGSCAHGGGSCAPWESASSARRTLSFSRTHTSGRRPWMDLCVSPPLHTRTHPAPSIHSPSCIALLPFATHTPCGAGARPARRWFKQQQCGRQQQQQQQCGRQQQQQQPQPQPHSQRCHQRLGGRANQGGNV
jgi:hypothetical protein